MRSTRNCGLFPQLSSSHHSNEFIRVFLLLILPNTRLFRDENDLNSVNATTTLKEIISTEDVETDLTKKFWVRFMHPIKETCVFHPILISF